MIKIAGSTTLFFIVIFLISGCRQRQQEPVKKTLGKEIPVGNNKTDLISISENLGGYFITTNNGRIFFVETDRDGFLLKRTFDLPCDTLYFTHSKIEANGDTLLWIGVRDSGFQKWKANGGFVHLRDYKIGFNKGKSYSPYQFLENSDGQFLISTSNGLYTNIGSSDTLQLIYPGKPTILSKENKDYEFRVYNIVKCRDRYFASMENGLLKVDKTGTDTTKVLSVKVKYVVSHNDTIFALVPWNFEDSLVHSGDFVIKPIPAGEDAIALHVEAGKYYIFYQNSTIVVENGMKTEFLSGINKFSKHPAVFDGQTGKTYSIQGDHLIERLSNDNTGSEIKLVAVAIDNQTNKTYFLDVNKNLYVSKKPGQASLLGKVKTPDGEDSWTAMYSYADNLFLISTNRVYKLWKPIIWAPLKKMQPVTEQPMNVINSHAQVDRFLYLGTRTGMVIMDLKKGALKTIERKKYFKSITTINDDTLLINNCLYFLTNKETFIRPEEKQLTFFQQYPFANYCKGWFDVANNSIMRLGDSCQTIISGVPRFNLEKVKTDNKSLIYFPAKNGGCATLNVDSNALIWLKVNDPKLRTKIMIGLAVLLVVVVLVVSVIKARKKGQQIALQKNGEYNELIRAQLAQLKSVKTKESYNLQKESQAITKSSNLKEIKGIFLHNKEFIGRYNSFLTKRERILAELNSMNQFSGVNDHLFALKKELIDFQNHNTHQIKKEPNDGPDKVRSLDEYVCILDKIASEIERLKKSSVSEEIKAEIDKINERIAGLRHENDKKELNNKLEDLKKLTSQFEALKGIFLIDKQIEQSKILATILDDFQGKDINTLINTNFNKMIGDFKTLLTGQDRNLLEKSVGLNNDVFRILVILLAIEKHFGVSNSALAAAIQTDKKEKTPDLVKNRKQDLKKYLKNLENESEFESTILQKRVQKLQQKWEKL